MIIDKITKYEPVEFVVATSKTKTVTILGWYVLPYHRKDLFKWNKSHKIGYRLIKDKLKGIWYLVKSYK